MSTETTEDRATVEAWTRIDAARTQIMRTQPDTPERTAARRAFWQAMREAHALGIQTGATFD